MTTMQALVLNDYQGSPFELQPLPRPKPRAGEVLVKVMASGVNPIDYKIRTGVAPYAMPELPAILGTDVAGVVEAVGTDVTDFSIGDAVYGLVGGVRGLPGTLAEYVAVDTQLLALKPSNLSMRQAAALPLISLTAWEGLIDCAQLPQQPSGQKVLVQGGAGGVGHIAIQIAKAHGAEVYATASAAKAPLLKLYGATALDYNTTNTNQLLALTAGQGFDIVYDTVGGKVLDDSFQLVRQYGHVLSCAAFGSHNLAPLSLRSATLSGGFVLYPMLNGKGRAHQGNILRKLTKLVEAEKLTPHVDTREFSLDTAMQAHDAVEAGSSGKVVITVCHE